MWAVLWVFLVSTVKFVLGGIPLAVLVYKFPFFKAVTVTSLGGFAGAIVFVYASDSIILYFKKRKEQKTKEIGIQKNKKIFTRTNKITVIVKQRFGLLGIALLTPLLFSIPIGCFIAVRYFKEKERILIYMFGSILFWAVSMYYLYAPLNEIIHKFIF
jgi:hypothetical protein